MPEVDTGCTKQVARILNCHDYTIITLRISFQLPSTVKHRQITGKPRVTTRIWGRYICMLHRQYLFRPSKFTAG